MDGRRPHMGRRRDSVGRPRWRCRGLDDPDSDGYREVTADRNARAGASATGRCECRGDNHAADQQSHIGSGDCLRRPDLALRAPRGPCPASGPATALRLRAPTGHTAARGDAAARADGAALGLRATLGLRAADGDATALGPSPAFGFGASAGHAAALAHRAARRLRATADDAAPGGSAAARGPAREAYFVRAPGEHLSVIQFAALEAGVDRRGGDQQAASGTAAVDNGAMSPSSKWSLASQDSFLSIGSRGSVLSIGSVGSVLSVGSVGSFASAFSIGSALSVLSLLSAMSAGSVM